MISEKLLHDEGDDDPQDVDTFSGICGSTYEGDDYNTDMISDQFSLTDSIKLAKEIIEQQTTLKPLVLKIKQKSAVGEIFTDILIYLCKLFHNAINDGTIHLVGGSHKEHVLKELKETQLTLENIKGKFDPEYPASHQEQKHEFIQFVPLSILLIGANKIAESVKSIWQPLWRRWLPSKMGMLRSLYQEITKVVEGIRYLDIDCKSFCELIGDVEQLTLSVNSVKPLLQKLVNSNLVLCVTFGAGAAICVIIGAVLIPTPAVAATLPLLITGGVLAWQSSVHMGLAALTDKVAVEVNHSEDHGYCKGQELLNKIELPNMVDYNYQHDHEVVGNQEDQEHDTLLRSINS